MHRVASGENLSKIGRKYRVSYKLIKDFNRLKSNRLRIGQKLIIPVAKPLDLKNGKYVVKRGDSLIKIAKNFETTVGHLIKINHLKGNVIHIGDRLSVYD